MYAKETEMNAPMTASQLQETTSIKNRAMKFRLSRGGTHRRVRDKDAETLVKQTLGDEGQIVSRELFTGKNYLTEYQALAGEMYSYHVKATLPFGDDGSRLLPNTAYFDYTSKMQNYISRLDSLKGMIVTNWGAMVQADINARNSRLIQANKPATASHADYPTLAQIEARLYVSWFPEPVATSNDFRFEVPDAMKKQLDDQISLMVEEAGRDLYVRMLKPVSAFVDKLSKFTGDKGQRWHDSFVDNLNALTKDLPRLNINDDPMVTSLLSQIDAIIKPYVFAPDALKDDEVARAAVKAKFAALESQLKGYAL